MFRADNLDISPEVMVARRPHVLSASTEALVAMLGMEIARSRRARRLTAQDLARRAGIARSTLHAIEHGSPGVAIGVVFEVAYLVGIDLFGTAPGDVPDLLERSRTRLALVPASARPLRRSEDEDDF